MTQRWGGHTGGAAHDDACVDSAPQDQLQGGGCARHRLRRRRAWRSWWRPGAWAQLTRRWRGCEGAWVTSSQPFAATPSPCWPTSRQGVCSCHCLPWDGVVAGLRISTTLAGCQCHHRCLQDSLCTLHHWCWCSSGRSTASVPNHSGPAVRCCCIDSQSHHHWSSGAWPATLRATCTASHSGPEAPQPMRVGRCAGQAGP